MTMKHISHLKPYSWLLEGDKGDGDARYIPELDALGPRRSDMHQIMAIRIDGRRYCDPQNLPFKLEWEVQPIDFVPIRIFGYAFVLLPGETVLRALKVLWMVQIVAGRSWLEGANGKHWIVETWEL